MKTLIEAMAKALVDQPDAVEVESEQSNDSTALRLKVASSDLGRIIGRQGRTARSLRIVLNAAGLKQNRRCVLDIAE